MIMFKLLGALLILYIAYALSTGRVFAKTWRMGCLVQTRRRAGAILVDDCRLRRPGDRSPILFLIDDESFG